MSELCQALLSRHIVRNALRIALVVGSILNVINQGENLLHADKVSWFHLIMNYLVPYCVASYSAARNELCRRETNDERTKSK